MILSLFYHACTFSSGPKNCIPREFPDSRRSPTPNQANVYLLYFFDINAQNHECQSNRFVISVWLSFFPCYPHVACWELSFDYRPVREATSRFPKHIETQALESVGNIPPNPYLPCIERADSFTAETLQLSVSLALAHSHSLHYSIWSPLPLPSFFAVSWA